MKTKSPAAKPCGDNWATAATTPTDVIEVTVRLSREQFEVFEPAANMNRASVGDLLLALASERLEFEPLTSHDSDAIYVLPKILWEHAVARFTPSVREEWADVGFPVKQPNTEAELACPAQPLS